MVQRTGGTFRLFFLTFLVLAAPRVFAAVDLKLTPIAQGLSSPLFATIAPGDSKRVFILEQGGKIRTLENGKLQPKAFLDVTNLIVSGGEMGLLGLAFHPDFARNGRYFVNYTTQRPHLRTVIAEYTVGNATGKEILTFDQPFTNHNGGMLAFHDGLLYIAAGDGGSAADPFGNGQNKNTLLGKILRIGVDGSAPYTIPADNPFAQGGGRGEIYAYGLRNPWRFSFDRLTGALFAGDVGQDKWEEIDLIEKGKNYGWNTMEGKHCFSPSSGCDQAGLTLPLVEYSHSQGISVTGGYVYRGSAVPELEGVYLYGDYGSGKVWGLTYDQTTATVVKNELLMETDLPIASFGEDADGEILLVSYKGTVYRIEKE